VCVYVLSAVVPFIACFVVVFADLRIEGLTLSDLRALFSLL